ncbi:MAG: acyl-CoA dehydrogenase family protein [Desulfobacteraceae bacterium]|jgi:alkylation response protein AidB-like acyl-CoA dehydrogenase
MDFNLSKEQSDIQKAAREFAKGEFDPDLALEHDKNQQFPTTILKKAGDLGFLGVHFPEAYDGQGLGLLENALIIEAFCRQDSGIGMALALSDFGSEMVLYYGNGDQKKRILPFVAHGEGLMTLAFLEDGYSLAPFSTKAIRDNNGYVIHGKKSFVTLGNLASFIIVVCQTDPGDPIVQTAFLVERETPGLEVLTMGQKAGMRMIPISQAAFMNVHLAKENVVGQEKDAYRQLKAFLDTMRIEAGAMGVGIAQGALDMALEYSKRREQFGRAIVSFDAIRNKLADMCIEVETSRLIVYKAAWSMDQGRPDHPAILISKVAGAKTAYAVANDCVQIYGGYGYMTEGQIEHFYRDAKVLDLFAEPGQAQKNLLADKITGRASAL